MTEHGSSPTGCAGSLSECAHNQPPATGYVIEYSINDGAAWHHGRTIEAWVRKDLDAMSRQRGAVRENAREWHGDVEHVVTRVLREDDPRAVNNQPPALPAPNDNVCTPATINGYNVLAAVRLTDGDGLAPNAHIVVCEHRPGRYVTWLVHNETGKWDAGAGHYDLTWREALTDMTSRALLWDGTRKRI